MIEDVIPDQKTSLNDNDIFAEKFRQEELVSIIKQDYMNYSFDKGIKNQRSQL